MSFLLLSYYSFFQRKNQYVKTMPARPMRVTSILSISKIAKPNTIIYNKAHMANEKKDYFEITIPRISFRNTPLNVYLVITLIIFAFLLGMLTNKVVYLQQTVKAQALTPTPPNQPAVANPSPTPP